jgi:hypothetical protein
MRKFVGALVLMLAVSIGAFGDEGYERYINIGFGYTVKYPKDVFRIDKQFDDQSGITLLSKNNDADMRVKAENNTDNTTLKYEYENLQSPDDKFKVIYEGEQWFEISGVRNGEVYYIKKMLKNNVYYTLEIEYPEAKKEVYAPVVNTIAQSFEVTGTGAK